MTLCTMLRLLVCCFCLTGLSCGNIIMEVSNEVKLNQAGKPVCGLNAELMRDCQPPVNSRSHLARPGTVCRNSTGSWQCFSSGEWKSFTEAVKFQPSIENLQKIKRHYRRGTEAMEYDLDTKDFHMSSQRRHKRFFWIPIVVCIFLCWGGGSSGPSQLPPNKTPTIKCPHLETQKPDVGKSMTVNWTEPYGDDAEQGKLNPERKGAGPGSIFEEGTHIITYYVADNTGAAASCHVIVKVEAYRCENLPWPRDGTRTCNSQTVSGSTCSVDCDEGFEVEGSRSVTCNKETWSGTLGKCQPISCGPKPDIADGQLMCPDETVFETFCTLSCDEGFQPEGNFVSECNKNGGYTTPGICQDITPPVFTDGCPLDLNHYAEKHNQPRAVTWPPPKVTDNSGNVTITSSPANGSLFVPGVTTVTLTATDDAGNSAGCKFKITINTLYCPEPDLGDERLLYNCSEGYGYGYSCSLTCESNFPLAGSSSILCDFDESTFPPNATWTWPDDSLKPFCKSVECPDLTAPENGALACDGWTNGLMCSMACNEAYDVPVNVPDQYTCGEQSGSWFPNDNVYGCTVKRLPGQMQLANEFYYYAGSCEDEETRQTIAENFVHILNTNLAFFGICGETVPDCQAKFVDVRCGEITNRKRRSVTKRETHNIIIEFNVFYSLVQMSEAIFSDISSEARDHLNDFIDVLYELLDNGELDMIEWGLTVQSDSYYAGYPKYYCENGVANDATGSCRGCPKGTFTDTSGDCVDCPIGTYNDVYFASSCTSCDAGFSTKFTRSTTPQNCTALCQAGSHSSDGMLPCIPCDSGTYAESIGSTTCTPCSATETSLQGATSSGDCVAYDLRIEAGSETVIAGVNSNLTSATLTFWFLANTSSGHTLMMLKNSEDNAIFGLSVMDSLSVDVSGSSVDTGAYPLSKQWQHVALTVDGSTKELVVFLMGQEVHRETVASIGNPAVQDTSSLVSTAITDDGILLSGITIAGSIVSSTELESLTKSCLSTVEDSELSFRRNGQILVSPSICDADDGCKESPCGSHPCQDRIDSFNCDCQDGWTGTTCQIPPDFCAHHKCQHNAICKNELTDYTCQCLQGFRGDYCEIEIVNGKWSEWTPWSVCSKTCDGGVRERSRSCDSPPPDDDGENCEGEIQELEHCGVEKCKECSDMRLSYGNKKSCWEEDYLRKCNVTCNNGMVFTDKSKLLPVYQCGAASGFQWNHQEAEGERARPPACTKAEGALSYSATHTVSFPGLPCTDGEQEKDQIHNQVSESINDLHCVKDGTCFTEDKQETCEQTSLIEKRAIKPTVISVTLTTEITLDISDDLETFVSEGTVSDALQSYTQQVLDADLSLQQMVNDSDTFFQLNLNGVVYNIDLDSMTTEAFISCRAGTVPTEGICAGCPPGTKEHGGSCVLCETGSYQDLPASTECKSCPKGKTTLYTGSLDVSECSAHVFVPEEKGGRTLLIVLCCVGGIVFMMAIVVSYFLGRKWYMSKGKRRRGSLLSLRMVKVQPSADVDSSTNRSSPPPPYLEMFGAP